MRAVTFHEVEDVRVESVAEPAIEAPGDALVAVELAGVCGSDLHVYHGRERGLDPGTVLGHELVGTVVEIGRGVRRLRPGDRVASPFTTSCGECFYCRGGLTARCERGQLLGWVERGHGLHGAQAERLRVPLADSTLVAIPEGDRRVEAVEALLAGDVLATGWYAAERAGAGPGVTVAVVGCGPVGVAAALAAGELGAERVFAIDPVAGRRALAARFGAEPLDPVAAAPAAAVREATGGRGADAVVEAVGTPEATRLAVDLARPGGTVSAVGVHTEPAFAFTPGEAYDKNLTYRAGRCPARAYLDRLLARLAERDLGVAALVSHRLPLADAAHAYRIFSGKLDGCTKPVLVP